MAALAIAVDDPRSPDVRALLEQHLAFAHQHTPPEDVHAMAPDALSAENVTFYSLREDGRVVAVGALRQLDPAHAEIKSMHTVASARGRGFGRAMVEHLVAVARTRGCSRVSLETGTMEAFAPARALYGALGFVECEPFAGYWDSPNSVCMTLDLSP